MTNKTAQLKHVLLYNILVIIVFVACFRLLSFFTGIAFWYTSEFTDGKTIFYKTATFAITYLLSFGLSGYMAVKINSVFKDKEKHPPLSKTQSRWLLVVFFITAVLILQHGLNLYFETNIYDILP